MHSVNSKSSSRSSSTNPNTNKLAQKLHDLRARVRPPDKDGSGSSSRLAHFLKSPPTAAAPTAPDRHFQPSHTPDRFERRPSNPLQTPKDDSGYLEALLDMKKREQHRHFQEHERIVQRMDEYPSSSRYVGSLEARNPPPRKPMAETMASADTGGGGSSGSRQRAVVSSQMPRFAPMASAPGTPMSAGFDIGRRPTPGLRSAARGSNASTAGRELRAPRPLSERARLPLDRSHIDTSRSSGLLAPPLRGPTPIQGLRSSDASTLVPRLERPPPRRARTATPAQSTCDSEASTLVPQPEIPKRSARRGRKASVGSMEANDGDFTDSDDPDSTPGIPSAREIRNMQATEDIYNMGGEAAFLPPPDKCFSCLEYCQPLAGICDKCKSDFEPSKGVFEDSGSEYSDQSPCPSPKTLPSPVAVTERTSHSLAGQRESWESWDSTPFTREQQDFSREASMSPTPALAQVATRLKLTVSPEIRKVSIASPTRSPTVLHRTAAWQTERDMRPQQQLASRPEPERNDSSRTIRASEVDLAPPNESAGATGPSPRKRQPRNMEPKQDDYDDWLDYYDVPEEDSEVEEEKSESHEPLSRMIYRNLYEYSRPSSYDRIKSIYDAYGSPESPDKAESRASKRLGRCARPSP